MARSLWYNSLTETACMIETKGETDLLALLLVEPQQWPQVQQGVDSWGFLPLYRSLLNVSQAAIVYIALVTLLNRSTCDFHHVDFVTATLQTTHPSRQRV